MNKAVVQRIFFGVLFVGSILPGKAAFAEATLGEGPLAPVSAGIDTSERSVSYTVGVDDILEVNVLKPDPFTSVATVFPDGTISFPYIGSVLVKGRTIPEVQADIQSRLANGYMKYPVVSVSLRESRSRKFFVYGEVAKAGSYQMEENTTVLRAISMAGGFSKYGSSSGVKVLRPRKEGSGYETKKINIKAVMDGSPEDDLPLLPGDIVVVSESYF